MDFEALGPSQNLEVLGGCLGGLAQGPALNKLYAGVRIARVGNGMESIAKSLGRRIGEGKLAVALLLELSKCGKAFEEGKSRLDVKATHSIPQADGVVGHPTPIRTPARSSGIAFQTAATGIGMAYQTHGSSIRPLFTLGDEHQ
ncbi:U-box domain-containing 44-like isoform X1 [Olea europaea subsp. europaea]|uniref:U-box domain-containing 44-like isoform X1 n=1 Tax=Olea europaea subsp. europaea TaxID=158383 RepID=A0A8S0V3F9_OLEEU|nr:U-box domain-containing 44-like isoform X1 [Olea europaea subsp. europaea]